MHIIKYRVINKSGKRDSNFFNSCFINCIKVYSIKLKLIFTIKIRIKYLRDKQGKHIQLKKIIRIRFIDYFFSISDKIYILINNLSN